MHTPVEAVDAVGAKDTALLQVAHFLHLLQLRFREQLHVAQVIGRTIPRIASM